MKEAKKYRANLKYYNGTVIIKLSRYANGNLALSLFDARNFCPVLKATSNLGADIVESDGELVIKNYSENEGVLKFLQINGIVGEVLRTAKSGFSEYPIVKINPIIFAEWLKETQ